MKIVTLTLSAAIDVHHYVDSLELGHENFVKALGRDAGGKGINISRALNSFGVENVALAVLGKDNYSEFAELLSKEGMSVMPILVPGHIRENVTVHTKGGEETRISLTAESLPSDTLGKIEAVTDEILKEGDVLTFTGSIPSGTSKTDVIGYLTRQREKGIRLIVDSRSLSLNDLSQIKPFLIKPNEYEIENYVGYTVRGREEAKAVAQSLRKLGIDNVMITLGERGAVISSSEGCFAATVPCVEVRSTIGAGDSTIAGFIYALYNGNDLKKAFVTAVAFGSSACLTEGTKPPLRETVIEMLENGIFVE